MKLVSKERIGGRIKRKYGTPLPPYQNLVLSCIDERTDMRVHIPTG
jgi:hypothetical protein